MADHTPTPWEVFDNGRLLVIAPGAGWSVFEIEASHKPDMPTHEANAAFIVRCVNAHDDLMNALTMCRTYLSDLAENDKYARDDLGLVDAVLAKAAS